MRWNIVLKTMGAIRPVLARCSSHSRSTTAFRLASNRIQQNFDPIQKQVARTLPQATCFGAHVIDRKASHLVVRGTAPDFAPTACIRGVLAPTGRSYGHYWKQLR
jgi:hypothetical protein